MLPLDGYKQSGGGDESFSSETGFTQSPGHQILRFTRHAHPMFRGLGLTTSTISDPSNALPGRRTVGTNSKDPRSSDHSSCAIPRRGRSHDRKGDQNPSGVSTCTAGPVPILMPGEFPGGRADRPRLVAPLVQAAVDAVRVGGDGAPRGDRRPEQRTDGRLLDVHPPRDDDRAGPLDPAAELRLRVSR